MQRLSWDVQQTVGTKKNSPGILEEGPGIEVEIFGEVFIRLIFSSIKRQIK